MGLEETKMRTIEIVSYGKRTLMKKYFDEYLVELSAFDENIKFDDDGTPIYKWFEFYWNNARRYPFFLLVDNEVAGICLVREVGEKAYEIAEFYVVPKFRGGDNAMWFARQIASKFDGEIEFSTRHKNKRAIAFWTKFANTYKTYTFSEDNEWENWTIKSHLPLTHNLSLKKEYFDKISNGTKTLEGRLNDEKRKKINIGDYIIFSNVDDENKTTKVKVLDKYFFDNFDQMLLFVDKNELGFDNKYEDNDILSVYRNIYPREKEDKYGVVILKIERV